MPGGPNKPSIRFWHQGFAVIRVRGRDVVPFMTRETAEMVAARATAVTKIPMIIVPVQDFWGYRMRVAM